VAMSLDEGELKVPKIPIEELLKLDSDEARVYLSNSDNYDYHTGISKVFYTVISSPKYLFLNLTMGLIQLFGGVLIFNIFCGKTNAT
jgi:hypothetical protein